MSADSNATNSHFAFPVFSLTWGMCSSLDSKPNLSNKTLHSGTLLTQGVRLLHPFTYANGTEAGALVLGIFSAKGRSLSGQTRLISVAEARYVPNRQFLSIPFRSELIRGVA